MKRILFVLICLLVLVVGCSKEKETVEKSTEISPLIDSNGADPWIFKKDDIYYYTKTTGNNVTLWKSKQLSTVAFGQEKVVWDMPSEFESAWAPELHYLDGQWIIYVALNKPGETHRMYAITNSSRDPYQGSWDLKPISGMDDKFAIDGTVLSLDSGHYFIWSGWEGYENVAQNLYIAKMSSATAISGKRQLISKPEFEWEIKQDPHINEGPEVLVSGNKVNLAYSASGSWDDDYSLGLLTLSTSADPMQVSNWSKSKEPILTKTDTTFGPGHNAFVKDDKGKDWLIYHAARWSHSGWSRSIRLQPLLVKDDMIQKMTPLKETETMTLPVGDERRSVYFAKDAQLSQGLRSESDENLSAETVVTGFSDTKEKATFDLSVKEAGQYTILAYVKTLDIYTDDNPVSVLFEINDKEEQLTLMPSDYYQPVGKTVELKKGRNKIDFSLEVGIDDVYLNRIEVIKD
ncbi:family 43 glycosylhydrolase [Streptococcus pluranimalium]|uniref:family 43 glycosylhydrolase n=1 Tax=Streptococcus pluranimalium TaxID=82348 RepID=UPI003F68E2E0